MGNSYKRLEADIDKFLEGFSWSPEVIGVDKLPDNPKKFVIAGMGGSALGANLLVSHDDENQINIHRGYFEDWISDCDLVIASSYSGNTEEIVDVVSGCLERNIPVAIVSHGGELLNIAKDRGLSHIVIPESPQPRYAIGYSYVALHKLVHRADVETTVDDVAVDKESVFEIAQNLSGKQLVFYSSPKYFSVAYVCKILANETAKQPAWANKFPELNHNEIESFESAKSFGLTDNTAVIMVRSTDDHPRIILRQDKTKDLLEEWGIEVVEINLDGKDLVSKVAFGWQYGMYLTLKLAELNQVDPERVKIIEDLKTALK